MKNITGKILCFIGIHEIVHEHTGGIIWGWSTKRCIRKGCKYEDDGI